MNKTVYMLMCILTVLGIGLPAVPIIPQASALAAATPETKVLNDFEDGTVQGWLPNGSGTVANVTSGQSDPATGAAYDAHSGAHALLSSGRTAAWNGPSVDVTSSLTKGATYQIASYVKLTAGEAPGSLKMTMKRTPTGSGSQYDQVNSAVQVTDQSWVKLQGTYTFTTDASKLLLYIESSDATASYLVDDFSIVETAPAPGDAGTTPPDTPGLSANFEDGTAQGWKARIGTESVTVSADDKHQGAYSLKTTGRQHSYDGPSLDVTGIVKTGSSYHVSLWVKLVSGEPAGSFRVSLQDNYQGASSYKTVIGNTAVTDGAWVNLAGDYTLADPADTLSLYVETSSGTASFYIDDFQLSSNQPPQKLPIQDIPSVYQAYAGYFPIGAAVEPGQTAGDHGALLKKHFNMIVAENAMKWDATEPAEGSFSFENADILAQFANDNNMKMRGHTLLWHQQVPSWVFLDASGQTMTPTEENKALLRSRLENHIKNVVQHFNTNYPGVVTVWDVVNEAIDESQPDGFRRSMWYQILGPEYIDDAFRYARKYAGPDAKLFINDYSTTNPAKRQFLYNLVNDLKSRGIPVDGVGHQMHIQIDNPSPESIRQTLEMFAGLGVDNQVTEMDMSAYAGGSSANYTTLPQDVAVQQGYRYRDIFDVYKQEKTAGRLTAVMLWGLADDHTWLTKSTRKDFPLLFDSQLQAKPAYWGVADPAKLPVLIQTMTVKNGTPSIDGRSEVLWDAVAPTTVKPADGAGSAVFKTLWDSTYLYVYAVVSDTSVNPNDKVDIYVDGNNGKTTAYQNDDAHYTLFRSGAAASGAASKAEEQQTGGYVLEAALPLTAAAAGKQIGFDIRFTDADSGKAFSWNDTTNSQDTDTSKYGTATLGSPLKVLDAVQGTPAIDANEDPVWANAPEAATGVWVQGTSGATATFKTMWDDGHLYVLAHVKDALLSKASSNAYEQDSVELFVDQNNHKTPAYEADDGQYRVNYANEQSYNGHASAANFKTATRIIEDGYIVEAAIDLDQIQAAPGALIGFDLQVNDDQTGTGHRDSVVTWCDGSGQSYQNTSQLGVVRLADLTPPTTTDDAPSEWANHDVTVTLSASDTGSGVAAT